MLEYIRKTIYYRHTLNEENFEETQGAANMEDGLKKFARFLNNFDLTYDKESKYIYHYTSATAMKSILESNTLRFTDRNYLNDFSEGKYVLKLCFDNINDLLENGEFKEYVKAGIEKRMRQPESREGFHIYQCSFSINKDNLSLWNYYTKSDSIKGYNIKLETDKLEDKIHPKAKDEHKNPPVYYGKVIYDKDRQLEILQGILERFQSYLKENDIKAGMVGFVAEYAIDKIIGQGVFFKKNCFQAEQEYRIAINPYIDSNGEFYGLKEDRKHMERNGIYIPYVDVKFSTEMVKGITMSPTMDVINTRTSILDLVSDKYCGLTEESIEKSDIPVRY